MPHKAAQLAKSASLISLATMLSRVLGLVREQLIAHWFSRTATDAFYVAFRIPNLLRDLFAEGAMSSAFVPTFTDYLNKQTREEAWRLASTVLNLLLVVLSVITLVGIWQSAWIVENFAGEYRQVPGKFGLTVSMTQIMFPFLPMVALAAVVMGMLNSQGRFFLPALAPAMFNVGSLVVAAVLYGVLPKYGLEAVFGMAVGTLTGGVLQLLVQVPTLIRQGFRYSLSFDVGHPGVRRVLLLMGPGTLGLAANQINIFINTWLATSQEEGAVSWLNYAFRLMQFPIGIFGVAIATAALPAISTHVSRNEPEELRRTLSTSLRMVFMINIPASLGLIFLSHPIIALIYQHGRFKATDTAATADALIYYSLGLFAFSAVKVLVPAFYALGHSRVPVAISAVTVALNVASNLVLIGPLGYRGLALGTSLASIFNFLVLLHRLQKYAGSLDFRTLATAFLKVLSASLVMGAACASFHGWFNSLVATNLLWFRMLALFLAIGVGLGTLFAASKALHIVELDAALRMVLRKLKKT